MLEQTVGGERRSGIAEAASRGAARGNGQYDDAKPDHRHSHEFKHQSIHGNSPDRKRQTCREAVDCVLIY